MAFSYSALTDLKTAEVMSGIVVRLLAPRTGETLLRHPSLIYAGDIETRGSNVLKIGHVGLDGYNIFGSVTDGATVAATDFTDGSSTVTVTRRALRYSPTDLARMTDSTGTINFQRFGESMVRSASETLVDLIANLGGGFTTTVGSSGLDMTARNFLDAKGALENNDVEGRYFALLHTQQFTDLIIDLNLNGGGAIQWNPASAELMRVVGNGYKGTLAGVDIFTSTRVPASGGNRQGFMAGAGAIAWGAGSAPLDDPNNQVKYGKLLFERDRDAAAGTTDWVGQLYLGVTEVLDGAGVGIITDQ
jgi:hypothetical protein